VTAADAAGVVGSGVVTKHVPIPPVTPPAGISIVWGAPAGWVIASVSVPPGNVGALGVFVQVVVPPAVVGSGSGQLPALATGLGTDGSPPPFALYVTVSVTNGVAGVPLSCTVSVSTVSSGMPSLATAQSTVSVITGGGGTGVRKQPLGMPEMNGATKAAPTGFVSEIVSVPPGATDGTPAVVVEPAVPGPPVVNTQVTTDPLPTVPRTAGVQLPVICARVLSRGPKKIAPVTNSAAAATASARPRRTGVRGLIGFIRIGYPQTP